MRPEKPRAKSLPGSSLQTFHHFFLLAANSVSPLFAVRRQASPPGGLTHPQNYEQVGTRLRSHFKESPIRPGRASRRKCCRRGTSSPRARTRAADRSPSRARGSPASSRYGEKTGGGASARGLAAMTKSRMMMRKRKSTPTMPSTLAAAVAATRGTRWAERGGSSLTLPRIGETFVVGGRRCCWCSRGHRRSHG